MRMPQAGETPLHLAALRGRLECLRELLDECLRELLDRGAAVDHTSQLSRAKGRVGYKQVQQQHEHRELLDTRC